MLVAQAVPGAGALGTATTVLAALGALLAGVYVLVAYGRKLVALGALFALALAFFGQQIAFDVVVRPYLSGLDPGALETALNVQLAFEVGFVAEMVIISVELAVERVFGRADQLRELSDGLFDWLAVVVIAGIIAALATTGTGSTVVLSTFSVLLAVETVEAVVDTGIALAQR